MHIALMLLSPAQNMNQPVVSRSKSVNQSVFLSEWWPTFTAAYLHCSSLILIIVKPITFESTVDDMLFTRTCFVRQLVLFQFSHPLFSTDYNFYFWSQTSLTNKHSIQVSLKIFHLADSILTKRWVTRNRQDTFVPPVFVLGTWKAHM